MFPSLRPLACAAVLAAASPAAAFESIHILGSFNGWDQSLWVRDPGMTPASATVWRDTIEVFPWFVEQGYQAFKFVTDRAWDEPPDYVLCPDRLDEYGPTSGPVCAISFGLDLVMIASTPGRWEMTLDEGVLTYEARLVASFTGSIDGTVQFGAAGPTRLPSAEVRAYRAGSDLLLAVARSSPSTGTFRVDSLAGGSYDLRVRAEGFLETVVRDIPLVEGGTADAGTIRLAPGCTTRWSAVQVLGDFNAWDTATPSMTQVAACVWEDTLAVLAGCHYMKFRTNSDWGQDYGTCTGQDPNCGVQLAGGVCLVDGENALGQLDFPAGGSWIFRLDEAASTYEIRPAVTAVLPAAWSQVKLRYR